MGIFHHICKPTELRCGKQVLTLVSVKERIHNNNKMVMTTYKDEEGKIHVKLENNISTNKCTPSMETL